MRILVLGVLGISLLFNPMIIEGEPASKTEYSSDREDYNKGYEKGFENGYKAVRGEFAIVPIFIVKEHPKASLTYDDGYRYGYEAGYARGKKDSE